MSERDSPHLDPLGATLLRAAAEGRLHHLAHIYRWRPRNLVVRSYSTPRISETGARLHALGLISHHENDTTCALTDRGRILLAAYWERDHMPAKSSNDSSNNPGTALGKELKDVRTKTGQTRGNR